MMYWGLHAIKLSQPILRYHPKFVCINYIEKKKFLNRNLKVWPSEYDAEMEANILQYMVISFYFFVL